MDELSQLGYVGKTICDFLEALAAEGVEELYSDGASVRVIFREALPPVAQQFVMRLAFGGARPFQEAMAQRDPQRDPGSKAIDVQGGTPNASKETHWQKRPNDIPHKGLQWRS